VGNYFLVCYNKIEPQTIVLYYKTGYGLRATGELFAAAADAIGASGAFVRRFFSNIFVINFSRHKYTLFENIASFRGSQIGRNFK